MSCDFISVSDAKFLIKYIFAFHIIKNNFYFFLATDSNHLFTSIPTRYLLHLNRDCDGSQPLTEPSGCPSIPAPLSSPSQQPQPAFTISTRWQIHSCPSLIPPDNIPDQEVSPPDSRLWRSLTGVITRITSNYTRNTYIYYYIYLEKHHISENTHIIAIYTNLLFSHFLPIFSL
jgi:hypothetical protein